MNLLTFAIGLVVGIVAVKMADYIQKHDLHYKWWQYLASLVWLAWTVFGLYLSYESFAEYEPRAGTIMLIFFGGISVIGAVLMARFWMSARMQPVK